MLRETCRNIASERKHQSGIESLSHGTRALYCHLLRKAPRVVYPKRELCILFVCANKPTKTTVDLTGTALLWKAPEYYRYRAPHRLEGNRGNTAASAPFVPFLGCLVWVLLCNFSFTRRLLYSPSLTKKTHFGFAAQLSISRYDRRMQEVIVLEIKEPEIRFSTAAGRIKDTIRNCSLISFVGALREQKCDSVKHKSSNNISTPYVFLGLIRNKMPLDPREDTFRQ